MKKYWGMDLNVLEGLSYIFPIIGLLFALINKEEDREARFKALHAAILGFITAFISCGIATIILAILAFTGTSIKAPIITDITNSILNNV